MFLFIIILSLMFPIYLFMKKKKIHDFSKDHCLITGGSSGIGLAIAVEISKLGGSITIVARSREKLEAAKKKILMASKNMKVLTFSADVANDDVDLSDIVQEAEKMGGPITMLFNCAGTSIASRFEETPLKDFKSMLNVNYLGSVKATQAVLPYMKKRKQGRIVFVSSLAGVIGLYGYTAYSGSKFALVGLAEALQMEVKSFNISVTVSFPPDTDTPGFAEEVKHKPLETAKISESGGLYSAEQVAIKTVSDAIEKKFMSSVGFEGWMLCTLCCGATPVNSVFQLVVQVLTMGLFRIAAYIYLWQCDSTIKRCVENAKQPKNQQNEEAIKS